MVYLIRKAKFNFYLFLNLKLEKIAIIFKITENSFWYTSSLDAINTFKIKISLSYSANFYVSQNELFEGNKFACLVIWSC